MNVPLIEMDRHEAREQLQVYERALKRGRKPNAEYEAARAGLAALANGTPLLRLADCFSRAGFDKNNMPRLAIARADRRQVRCSWSQPSRVWRVPGYPSRALYFDAQPATGPLGRGLVIPVVIPDSHRPRLNFMSQRDGRTLVPMIPPTVREQVRFSDSRTFILWEVEKWEPVPSRDPFLLRHIVGDTYAVLAQWDLTPLEQAVMAGRAGLN